MEKIESKQQLIFDNLEKQILQQIQEIRKLLHDDHNINIPKDCNDFIARCLRHKDGRLENTIKLIKSFNGFLADISTWDAAFQPSVYHEYYSTGGFAPLRLRDSDGHKVFLARTKYWFPEKVNFDEAVAAILMMNQWANAHSKHDQRNGLVVIWDFSGLTLHQAWAVKHKTLLHLIKCIQNGVSGRLKGLHLVNHKRVVNVIYAGVKPILSEKIKARVHFHNDLKSLHEKLGTEILPTFLGGDVSADDYIDEEFLNDLAKGDEFFQDMINNGWPTK